MHVANRFGITKSMKYFRLVTKDVSLLQNVQTGSEAHLAPYPLSSGVTSGGGGTWAWNWPLISF